MSRYEQGLAVRRAVLGDEYVDGALKNKSAFSGPFQELVTEWCWGSIWTRPGLDLKTRSMLNIAMLSALGKPSELRLHVRGALNNGVKPEEIREILLQVAVYCGIPSALEAFNVAGKVIEEEVAKTSA